MMALIKTGDYGGVRSLAATALEVDNCTQGVHTPLATAHRHLGALPEALKTMNRAILYEAPWDRENMIANIKTWEDFFEVLREEEERKRREHAFLEKWGRLIEDVKNGLKDGIDSWSSLKKRRYDMHAEYDDEETEMLLAEEQQMAEDRDRQVAAAIAAIRVSEEDMDTGDDFDEDDDNVIVNEAGVKLTLDEAPVAYDCLKVTKEVRKWWERERGKTFFKVSFTHVGVKGEGLRCRFPDGVRLFFVTESFRSSIEAACEGRSKQNLGKGVSPLLPILMPSIIRSS